MVGFLEWLGCQVLQAQNSVLCVPKTYVDFSSLRQIPSITTRLITARVGIHSEQQWNLLASSRMNNADHTFRTYYHTCLVVDIQKRSTQIFTTGVQSFRIVHSAILGINAEHCLYLSPIQDSLGAHHQSQDPERSAPFCLHGLVQDA